MTQKKQMTNPLGTDRISTLVARFAVPSIIAMLVSAVYNIADQLFIGNAVGTLGNAATNIAFPLSMLCTSAHAAPYIPHWKPNTNSASKTILMTAPETVTNIAIFGLPSARIR